MYQQQFGLPAFPGANVNPSTLDRINPAHYQAIADIVGNGQGVKSFFGHRLFDTARLKAGALSSSHRQTLFQKPAGEQGAMFNSSADKYNKLASDTNYEGSASGLPTGYEFWCWSMQVIVEVPGMLNDSNHTANDFVGLPNATGLVSATLAADALLGANLAVALRRALHVQLTINNGKFERGNIALFPSKSVVTGAGSSTGTFATPVNDVVFCNGGDEYKFPIIRHIDSQMKFGVELSVSNDLTLPCDLPVTIVLEGLMAQPVTG